MIDAVAHSITSLDDTEKGPRILFLSHFTCEVRKPTCAGADMTTGNSRYGIPKATEIELKVALSDRLKHLREEARENSFEMYLYAAALRLRYMNKSTGNYTKEFHDWYAQNDLNQLYGRITSTFSKYAAAGEIVNYFGQHYKNGKYINQLPLSLRALYELAMLKKVISETALEKLFFTGGDDKEALIHPNATSADIAAFHNRSKSNSAKGSKARKTQFNISLATIYVRKDIYRFHVKTGDHLGKVDLSDTERAVKRLRDILDAEMFDVRDNLDKITTTYKKREDKAAPSFNLRVKKTAKKKR